jgi:hypothetical protein
MCLFTFQGWESFVGARYACAMQPIMLNRCKSYGRDHYFRHCSKSRGKIKKDEQCNILNVIVKVTRTCAFIGVYAMMVYQ